MGQYTSNGWFYKPSYDEPYDQSGGGIAAFDAALDAVDAKLASIVLEHGDTTAVNISVPQNSSSTLDISNCCNRGLVHFLEVSSNNSGGYYDFEMYDSTSFSNLLYKAVNIQTGVVYRDYLPFWVEDVDLTSKFHLKITNKRTSTVVFNVRIKYEKFA